MIMLNEVSDYIASLGIAQKENCYHGIMQDKKDKSIGTYPQKRGRAPESIDMENSSYYTRELSFLIHWTNSPSETEKAAHSLYNALRDTREQESGGHIIKFIQMIHAEPIPVGTDENGIFEYVIECIFYMEAEKETTENEERKE